MVLVWQELMLRLLLALLLGSIIGSERQWRQHTAGLRTNALVAIGSASFVLFGTTFANPDSMARVVCQVIPGIGFLGAGVIMREGSNIKGLNTAATLWCSAAVGMFAGIGMPVAAGIITGFITITNLFLRPLVGRMSKNNLSLLVNPEIHYTMTVTCNSMEEARIRMVLLRHFTGNILSLRTLESLNTENEGKVVIKAHVVSVGRQDSHLEHIIGSIVLEPSITSANWMVTEKN
jgi:putative Mg2+ transporter-C (MgtC) family protein